MTEVTVVVEPPMISVVMMVLHSWQILVDVTGGVGVAVTVTVSVAVT